MLYFSGTGNSKYIAEQFCRYMNAACYSIEEKIDFTPEIAAEDTVGFCYPIYGSRVPRIMREFAIKHMESLKGKKLIIFCTQLIFSGDGARVFTDIFPRGYVKVIYAEHFPMPNNVCNMFFLPLPDEVKIQKYIENADRKIQTVVNAIRNGKIKKRGFNPISRILGLFQGSFMPWLERKSLSKVWIDKSCGKCLVCVSVCPMHNFKYDNEEITTNNNCTMCYRCINQCPKKAIAVFLRGKVKKQYRGV